MHAALVFVHVEGAGIKAIQVSSQPVVCWYVCAQQINDTKLVDRSIKTCRVLRF